MKNTKVSLFRDNRYFILDFDIDITSDDELFWDEIIRIIIKEGTLDHITLKGHTVIFTCCHGVRSLASVEGEALLFEEMLDLHKQRKKSTSVLISFRKEACFAC